MGQHAGRLEAKIVSRGQGHSAVSKAAYNARATLENDRLGTRDDYSRKNAECLFSGIYAPTNAPDWTRDREQLWNHVEAFEKRKDSQLARELLIDLAHELTPEQNRRVLQDFIRENFTRNGLVVDAAIHAPHKHSDDRNIHAHVMIVLRQLDGTEFEAGKKPRQTLSERTADLDGWKRAFEKRMNRELERHGHEPRWDLRSNEARGLDREPGVHLGKDAAALERQGIETAPGDLNREIDERNRARTAANQNDRGDIEAARQAIADLEAQLAAMDAQQAREAARPNSPEFIAAMDAALAREAQERGDNSARDARRAMEDLARIDPVGTARNFGHHTGDRLKSPEEMRREYEDLVRGGGSADRAAENAAAWEKALSAEPEQARDSAAPDPTRERVDWSRLNVSNGYSATFALTPTHQPAKEAARQPEKAPEPQRQPEPEPLTQAPEKRRGGLFGLIARLFIRQEPEPQRPDHAADRRHDRAGDGDRQEEHVRPRPVPVIEIPQELRARPAERMRQSIADQWLEQARDELAADRAAETPEQTRQREEQERGRGDGSRDRTRRHHSLLWELMHPFHHHPGTRHRHRKP